MRLQKAAEILKDCEQGLQQVIRDAAASGDYERLMQVTDWARMVAAMVGDAEQAASDGDVPVEIPQTPPAAVSSIAARTSSDDTQPVPSSRRSTPKGRRRKLERGTADYPKFARRGSHLVKIAWSRKQKKEYQHKAPRHVALLLAGVLAEAGHDGRVVQMGDLLPIREDDGSEVPSYQAYLALAWLKKSGLVDQHGRQGYSVPKTSGLREAVDSMWDALPHIR
jgi:hypothetical protein